MKVGNRTFKNIDQWQVEYIVENFNRKMKEVGDEIGLIPKESWRNNKTPWD